MEQHDLFRYRSEKELFLRDVGGGLLREAATLIRKANIKGQKAVSKDNETKKVFAILYDKFILTANREVYKNWEQGYLREDISTEKKVIEYAKKRHIESWVYVKTLGKILKFNPDDIIKNNWPNMRPLEIEDKVTGKTKQIKIPMYNYSIQLGRDILS